LTTVLPPPTRVRKTPTPQMAIAAAMPVNVKATLILMIMWTALMPQPSSEVLEEMAAIDPVSMVISATETLPVTVMWMELMPPSSNQTLEEMLVTTHVRPVILCPGVCIRCDVGYGICDGYRLFCLPPAP